MSRRILILIGILAVPLSLIAGPAVQAAVAQDASTAVVTPASGPPGSTVNASGTNWTPGDNIQAEWGDDYSNLGTPVVVASDGSFTDSFAIPSSATPGSHQVLFWDQEGQYFEVANFDVTSASSPPPSSCPAPSVSFAPAAGPVGTTFTIAGSSWVPGGTVTSTLPYGSPGWFTGYQTPTVDADGSFSFKETVGTGPGGPTPPGTYVFTYVENHGGCSLSVSQTFTVASPTWAYQAGNYAGKSGMVSVVNYPEPNSLKYVNYCGPAASRVLISGWTKHVPSLSALASEEETVASGPNAGTLATNMPGPINNAIGADYYSDQGSASTQAILSNRIGYDILHGHPLITALMTGVTTGTGQQIWLNGWDHSGFRVAHIVTIYGFDFTSPTQGKIYYMETAGTVSGTDRSGPQEIDYQDFWALVQANNVQIAGTSGL